MFRRTGTRGGETSTARSENGRDKFLSSSTKQCCNRFAHVRVISVNRASWGIPLLMERRVQTWGRLAHRASRKASSVRAPPVRLGMSACGRKQACVPAPVRASFCRDARGACSACLEKQIAVPHPHRVPVSPQDSKPRWRLFRMTCRSEASPNRPILSFRRSRRATESLGWPRSCCSVRCASPTGRRRPSAFARKKRSRPERCQPSALVVASRSGSPPFRDST